MTPKKPDTTSQWNMRLPDKMKAALSKEAKAARRDLTAHMLYLLETHPERPNVKSSG